MPFSRPMLLPFFHVLRARRVKLILVLTLINLNYNCMIGVGAVYTMEIT